MEENELKNQIMDASIALYREKGLHFTMQDVAEKMHIAKKTIYKIYPGKEELLIDLIQNGFEKIHSEKQKILDSDLPIEEKLEKVLIAMPQEYETLDFRQLEGMVGRYPKAAALVKKNLETNWDPTLQLLEEGEKKGIFRPVSLPVFRLVATASFEAFLSTDTLESCGIAYQKALQEMADILMKGVVKHDSSGQ